MPEKAQVERLTISLPPSIATELEQIQKNLGGITKSAAIRTAIREYLADHCFPSDEGWRIGTLITMYAIDNPESLLARSHIKSSYRKIINADTQVPLANNHIFEVLVVKGHTSMINPFITEIQHLKDNKIFRVLLTACERQMP